MNKKNSLIIGSGVLGAYLANELLKNKQEVIVTSQKKRKNYKNYNYLNIKDKVKFEKLNIKKKDEIKKIIKKYNPNFIYYFAGQSSLTKSYKLKKETYESHYVGTKNFLEILKKTRSKIKFFKANSGYIFKPYKGMIKLDCKLSLNKNPYIKIQQKVFKLIKKYRKFNLSLYSLIFLQVESPLRKKDFFIKKVCFHAKNKKKISVGNVATFRDYSWAPEVAKSIYYLSKFSSRDIILSSGIGISGSEILKIAYKQNKLNYKKYFKIDKKFYRKKEDAILIGDQNNSKTLTKRFGFKFSTYGSRLVKKMYKQI
tara:strand:+ start:408 stop:1343 length:936 start_codon:yes stop_codon:yes gene_type:complete